MQEGCGEVSEEIITKNNRLKRAESPNVAPSPGQRPGVGDGALIKVSRSERAICFMRGNAPCDEEGYALSARGIFESAQKCQMY